MLYSYYLGLDLGQSKDYTALAVLEEPLWVPSSETEPGGWAWRLNIEEAGWVSPANLAPYQFAEVLAVNHHYGRPHNPPLYVRHLERFPLGTRYPKVIERVLELAGLEPLHDKRSVLLVDKTGVGASVVDSFAQAGANPLSVTIHGGEAVSRDRDGYRVPKRDLVSAAQVLLQNGRLKIAEGLEEAETLKRELLNFKVKIDPKTAHDSYSHWREAEHDDLVLATAMACWFRQWWNRNLDLANARTAPGVVNM